MMAQTKPWEGRLAQVEECRQRPRSPAQVLAFKGKGKPPPRKCPDDFDIIFVEIGRLDCETWYRASRITVNRWLDERGKERLILARAAFVQRQRVLARPPMPEDRSRPVKDRRRVNINLARRAAQYLRQMRNGGWIISPTPHGDWWVGSKRRTAGELLDMAIARGFDVRRASQQMKAENQVGPDPAPRMGDFATRKNRIVRCQDAEAAALRAKGISR